MCTREVAPIIAPLTGEFSVPGDKSISHRAAILAAIAHGHTKLNHFLASDDCLATLQALIHLGASIRWHNNGILSIQGVGMRGLKSPYHPINVGNAATALRLLCGLLAGHGIKTMITGDRSLCSRPMARIVEPLRFMGANIGMAPDYTPPLSIGPSARLKGIDYTLPLASAQVKTSLILAALYAQTTTVLYEPKPTRDHTERLLSAFDIDLAYDCSPNMIMIQPNQSLRAPAQSIDIAGDFSSAAFFIVAATIVPNSNLRLNNVGINPTRIGCLYLLRKMGAHIHICNQKSYYGEPVADIVILSASLYGIVIEQQDIAISIDELPILFIAAACAYGKTTVRGAGELRYKESDRLLAMAQGLCHLGIECQEYHDGLSITGGILTGGAVDAHDDHRVGMAFSIAALVAQSPVTIKNCTNIETSFPHFFSKLQALGARLTKR